jgi:N-acetylglucosaminyl-diphospho-decaprenol L-rhamnosyltransferase
LHPDAAGEPAVQAVIVTFNSASVVERCLASLPDSVAVTVVDNASRDGTLATVERARPDASVIALPRNLGYGTAANRGFAASRAPFAMLLNPDIALRPGAIEALAAAAERYPDGGLFAPAIRDVDGRMELRRRTAYARFLTNPSDAPFAPEGDCCAPYVGGAVMFFRRSALDAIGGFDERIFLFSEDDDICLRLAATGWSLVHVAEAEADHLGARSSSGIPRLAWWKHWHRQWSRLYLARKHAGAGTGATLAQLADAALRAGWYSLRRDDERAQRYSATLAATAAFLAGREARDIGLDDGREPRPR